MINGMLAKFGFRLSRLRSPPPPIASLVAEDLPADDASRYNQDSLFTPHNHDFMRQPNFIRAYQRGVKAAEEDYNWHWRVYMALCAASHAARLHGDFVEFGVNRGFLSSAIMELLDWNTQGRTFFLLDTFAGIDERYISDAERAGHPREERLRD